MTATKTTRPTVEQLIEEFKSYREDPEQIRRDEEDLKERLRGYEQKYGMRSADVHAAIDRKELQETLEVCDWLMDYHDLEGSWPE